MPGNYNQDQRQWPLLFFHHGRGERGSDINRVKTHGPPKTHREREIFLLSGC